MALSKHWGTAALLTALFAAGPAAAEDRNSTDTLRREVENLERLAGGTLPAGVTLQQLFRIDASNPGEVAELRAELESRRGRTSASASEESALRERAIQLRLQFLGLPEEIRTALVEIDHTRQTALLEVERAEAARKRAEADAATAEAARQDSLGKSEKALGAAERFAADERARLESARRDQAQFRERLAAGRSDLYLRHAAQNAELMRVRARLAPDRSPEASQLYDDCVEALVAARQTLRSALAAVGSPVDVPRYNPAQSAAEDAAGPLHGELRAAARELDAAAGALAVQERLLRHESVELAYERVKALNAARIMLIELLPSQRRDRVLGFGREGLAQLQRELDHLELQIAWYRYARANLDIAWSLVTGDTAFVLRAAWDAAVFSILCAIGFYLARNAGYLLGRARLAVLRTRRSQIARDATLRALDFADALHDEILLVAVALLAPWALGELYATPEVELAHTLFLCFALYRFALSAAYHGIEWLAEARAGLPRDLRDKTLRSLRFVGRYLLATVVILAVSAEVLGRGYLYHVVANIWWIGGLPIAAILIRRWQPDIVEAYLAYRTGGVMADMVRATRDRWYGFFVTTAAVSVLIAVAAAHVAARFAMGFEQTRRALAFLFRRRLERQAERQAEPVEATQLPEALRAVLSEDPVEDPKLLVDHYPGLEAFTAAARQWVDGGAPCPTLLAGDTGYGKTTWLHAAANALKTGGLEARVLTPRVRMTRSGELLSWLAGELGIGGADSVEAMAAKLGKHGRMALFVDDGQLLFSRSLGGFDAWDTLAELAGTDSTPILWTVAVARYPFDYLNWARQGVLAPFRHVRALKPWSDTQIAELLRARTRACGIRVLYDDLIVDQAHGRQRHLQLLRTETEYARLIWDYAEGCPRTALQCWRASLVPAGPGAVRVRLFHRPPVERLETLTLRERFVLAAIVWHQTLTVDETVAALRYPAAFCEDTLALLRELGVVQERESVFRLQSNWLQPARRLLRREHLVPA